MLDNLSPKETKGILVHCLLFLYVTFYLYYYLRGFPYLDSSSSFFVQKCPYIPMFK